MLERGHISHLVKMNYFFSNLLLDSQALVRQTMYMVIMTTEGSTRIINFMTMGHVFVMGHGHISQIVNMCNFIKNLIFYYWV